MPKEQVEIHLVYEGPDVDGGSMSIEDIVPVLQGFSSAYGKIAVSENPNSQHDLRIAGVRPGSADIVVQVWQFLGDNAGPIGAAGGIVATGFLVFNTILQVIALKRHVKKQAYTESINATNSIVITNAENGTLIVPLRAFEWFKGGSLDADMNRIVRPLEKGKIEATAMSAQASDTERVEERITADERPYFDVEQLSVTSTTATWLVAKLDSHTKNTNSGWLHLVDGTRVFYKYVGENMEKFLAVYLYNGPVKIHCVAYMDSNLKVNRVDITDLEKAQGELFTSPPPAPNM